MMLQAVPKKNRVSVTVSPDGQEIKHDRKSTAAAAAIPVAAGLFFAPIMKRQLPYPQGNFNSSM